LNFLSEANYDIIQYLSNIVKYELPGIGRVDLVCCDDPRKDPFKDLTTEELKALVRWFKEGLSGRLDETT
jgi:hypothetical protein